MRFLEVVRGRATESVGAVDEVAGVVVGAPFEGGEVVGLQDFAEAHELKAVAFFEFEGAAFVDKVTDVFLEVEGFAEFAEDAGADEVERGVFDSAGVVKKEWVDGVAVQVDTREFKTAGFEGRCGLPVGSLHAEVGTALVHELNVLIKKMAIGSCIEDC